MMDIKSNKRRCVEDNEDRVGEEDEEVSVVGEDDDDE